LKDGDEMEFFENEKGVFILISKSVLTDQVKKSILAELAIKASGKTATGVPVLPAAQPIQASRGNPLGVKGYLVIDNELEAKQLSMRLEKEIKGGEIIGVRGFDKKFYIVSTSLYQNLGPRIETLLKDKQTVSPLEVSQSLNLEEPCAIAVLQVMKEQGELIEKKRGVFAAIK
jgi:hypothetical protein